jgi:hypothetical protein
LPTHYWGDKDFDWEALDTAMWEGASIMRKYGKVWVSTKEKYGTARWDIYLYYSSKYPSFLNKIVQAWQKVVICYAFTVICKKYPHIRDELLSDAPSELLPPDLALITAKMWSNTCDHCGEWSTTDHYKCPSCGEIKKKS